MSGTARVRTIGSLTHASGAAKTAGRGRVLDSRFNWRITSDVGANTRANIIMSRVSITLKLL